MTDEKIEAVAEAAKAIVEAVPVYHDVAQPAAREVGLALQTIAKTIHIALAPVSGLVWGYEQLKDFVSHQVAQKLRSVPAKDIQTPRGNVAGPALEALRYCGHLPDLRELYANLLAASMDSVTAPFAHPAFVDIIKQMTPDEARLVRHFATPSAWPLISLRQESKDKGEGIAVLVRYSLLGGDAGCEHPELATEYLDNLLRLGLIEIPADTQYTAANAYTAVENSPLVKDTIASIEKAGTLKARILRHCVYLTPLGQQFINACVLDHEELRCKRVSAG